MIKKILKYCVPAYVLSGIISFIAVFVITGPVYNLWLAALFTVIVALFIALIISSIGLLFGLIPSILIQRASKEKIFYWVGQIAAFIVFYAWFINSMVPDLHKHTKKTTAQENEATILSLTNHGKEYFARIAFDSLELKFKTPDDFVLNTYIAFEHDSTIDSKKDPIYTVYFSYTLKDDKTKELMAKYLVIDHKAILASFDIDKYENAEFMRVYKKQEALKARSDKFYKAIN
jgi:hypothetical protein